MGVAALGLAQVTLSCRPDNSRALSYQERVMRSVVYGATFLISLISAGAVHSADLKNLTDSVMNGWRADYQRQMGSLLSCVSG